MKFFLALSAVIAMIVVVWLLLPRNDRRKTDKAIALFKTEVAAYIKSAAALKTALSSINKDSAFVLAARESLIQCRLQYKHLSFFLEYYFPEQALVCNGPPVPEIENGLDEYRDPVGMQVVESYLFAEDPLKYRKDLLEQADMLQRSLSNILPFLENFKVTEKDIISACSLELTRIYTLYITGYDAPQLKSGIAEAAESLRSVKDVLGFFLDKKDKLFVQIDKAEEYLAANKNFDSFNRLYFITTFMQALQQDLNGFNLFAPGAIQKAYSGAPDTALAALGRLLFSERTLSGNNSRSCSTCHSPTNYFSDRLKRNKNREGTGDLPRNTPSLLYSAFQYNQFWDGRVFTLEQQAITVMNDTLEMKGTDEAVADKLKKDPAYAARFHEIWKAKNAVTEDHIAAALAAYIRTLAPFHSSFDQYMNGNRHALSDAQKRGFNLFMGKAQCGSCHFAPLFNGLFPPLYNRTEFEILGTTVDDNFLHPQMDSDTGRAVRFPDEGRGAFKTPTVRNAAMTAPYMHNGGFASLETVIDFYDKGGGRGLGLPIKSQTLSDIPLQLTSREKSDIKSFIESLTDK